ncbi:hypothetical protein VCRA2122O265_60061 [Vibrio crassostreae]|nr:hypothetical protein VCRA2125O290_60061 [Vibrio crassostreae]CAK3678792.1 hypothetical protein VCRA2122O265_60061 [Vibrio crassostreae]
MTTLDFETVYKIIQSNNLLSTTLLKFILKVSTSLTYTNKRNLHG